MISEQFNFEISAFYHFICIIPSSTNNTLTIILTSADSAVYERLKESLETILNRATDPPKSKKIQHTNAKNAVLFEAINLIIHYDR